MLPAGARPPKALIKQERRPRQITEILQQRKQREKDRHRRQHDRNDPRRRRIDPVQQRTAQLLRHMEVRRALVQQLPQAVKAPLQPLRGVVCPLNRQPEYAEQEQHKHKIAPDAVQEHSIESFRFARRRGLFTYNTPPCDLLRTQDIPPRRLIRCLPYVSAFRCWNKTVAYFPHLLLKRLQALTVIGARCRNGYAEFTLQPANINRNVRAPRLIH